MAAIKTPRQIPESPLLVTTGEASRYLSRDHPGETL